MSFNCGSIKHIVTKIRACIKLKTSRVKTSSYLDGAYIKIEDNSS